MDPQQSGENTTSVKVYASNHIYSGRIVTKGYRVTDMLNDRNTELVELQDVTVTQQLGSDVTTVTAESLMVRKSFIDLVVPGAVHEAPMRRFYNYQVKERYNASLILPGLVVTGIMHLPARLNAQLFFGDTYVTQDYFGMTEASVRSSMPRLEMEQVNVVIFNRHRMEGLSLEQELATAQTFSLLDDKTEASSNSNSGSQLDDPAFGEPRAPGLYQPEIDASDPFYPGSSTI